MSIYRHETPRIPTGAVAARIDLPDHPPQPVNPAFKFQILREASEVRIYGEVAVAHHHSIFAAATARQPGSSKFKRRFLRELHPPLTTCSGRRLASAGDCRWVSKETNVPDPQLRWRTMNSTPTQTQAALAH